MYTIELVVSGKTQLIIQERRIKEALNTFIKVTRGEHLPKYRIHNPTDIKAVLMRGFYREREKHLTADAVTKYFKLPFKTDPNDKEQNTDYGEVAR